MPDRAARGSAVRDARVLLSPVVARVGVAGVVEAEREAAGVGWAAVFSTSLGDDRRRANRRARGHRVRGADPCRSRRDLATHRCRRSPAIGAAASMWVDVAASHAGAQAPGRGEPHRPVGAHRCRCGVDRWPAGADPGVRGQPSDMKGRAVLRFSTTAGFAIVVVAVTGTFRAVIEIGSRRATLRHRVRRARAGEGRAVRWCSLRSAPINRFGNVPRAASVLQWFAPGRVDGGRDRRGRGAGRRGARECRATAGVNCAVDRRATRRSLW